MPEAKEIFLRDAAASQTSSGGWLSAQSMRLVLYAISLTLDIVAVAGGYFLSELLIGGRWSPVSDSVILGIIIPLFVMFSISREVQSVEALQDYTLGFQRAAGALIGAFIVVVMLLFLTEFAEKFSRLLFVSYAGVALGLLALSKLILNRAVHIWLGGGVIATLVLLDGQTIETGKGMTVVDVGAMGLWPDPHEPNQLNSLSMMVTGYDRIVVACEQARYSAWSIFLQGSDVGGEIVIGKELSLGGVGIGHCAGHSTVILSRGPLSLANRLKKRALDLAVAIPLTLFLAPFLAIVALAIALDSPGPVFFRQERIGQGNRRFRIWKFRSMLASKTDLNGDVSAGRNDDRISRVGRFIRRTSIDELPQLFNVLAGDMSLVGPRPHALGSLAGQQLFWEVDPKYWLRHSIRPGITGLAQVRGFRGATDVPADLENRLRSDLEYVSNWSIYLDFRILLATCKVLVHDKAY